MTPERLAFFRKEYDEYTQGHCWDRQSNFCVQRFDELLTYAEEMHVELEHLRDVKDATQDLVSAMNVSKNAGGLFSKLAIKRHIAYARYVLRHKWYVFKARDITGVSLWRALTHDLSKFTLAEWMPYARCFYDRCGNSQYEQTAEFDHAWNLHQKRNMHHWQAWVLIRDGLAEGGPLEMPEKYVREMVADWIGASMACTGKNVAKTWYLENKDNMQLHPMTRVLVEYILEVSNES
jgi:hypothetical protein